MAGGTQLADGAGQIMGGVTAPRYVALRERA